MTLFPFVPLNPAMASHADFLDPQLSPQTIDLYLVRKGIVTAIQQNLHRLSGTCLDIGCGYMPYKPLLLSEQSRIKSYIGLDLPDNLYQAPDLTWDGLEIPLDANSIDCAIATELFEHCPYPSQVMAEIHRVLKPGGTLLFSVPFLWNLHCVPHDEYRFTPFALERLLKNAGFTTVQLQALGGWDASLGQMLGLWVRRRFQGGRKKTLLRSVVSIFATPIVWSLYKLDRPPASFYESAMITGITGTAQKPCPTP